MSETEEMGETVAIESLPLDAWHRARGARMVEFAGYHMPIQYDGIMAEHLWTRDNAGLFDVSHMGQLVFSGEGAAEALEALVPGDISALKPGRMRYSLLLADDGGILDDLMVTNTGHGLYMVVNGAVKWDDIAHLREHLPDEIEMNLLDEQALLALQGPKAAAALTALGVVPEFPDILPVDRLVFMQAGPYLWGDVPLGISRSGYTGEDGFEISVPASDVSALADALCAQEAVKPIGLGARDSLRLEAGLPLYGHDLDEGIDPVEGDLAFAISKRRREEGGFPGAARILGHLADGSPRKRVGLTVDGKMPVREGAKIFDGNSEVGVGYVPTGLSEPGTALAAEVRGKRVAVTVTPMPFVPHRYVRKQGG